MGSIGYSLYGLVCYRGRFPQSLGVVLWKSTTVMWSGGQPLTRSTPKKLLPATSKERLLRMGGFMSYAHKKRTIRSQEGTPHWGPGDHYVSSFLVKKVAIVSSQLGQELVFCTFTSSREIIAFHWLCKIFHFVFIACGLQIHARSQVVVFWTGIFNISPPPPPPPTCFCIV